jgi:hypothetical protein
VRISEASKTNNLDALSANSEQQFGIFTPFKLNKIVLNVNSKILPDTEHMKNRITVAVDVS